MEYVSNVYKDVVKKPEGKRPLEYTGIDGRIILNGSYRSKVDWCRLDLFGCG
jgi:hypothetical protein